ncbi:DNA primase family protein [Enterococcus sp. DIV0098]|uniref:DNA primase family protein n=1 Tax=Enterococcus sp. DIV0098 TaxID=2774843 RepID=UPI003F68715D
MYTSIGYSTKKMQGVGGDKSPFRYLWYYQAKEVPIDETFAKESIKETKAAIAPFKKNVVYFLAGELLNGQRSNENLLQKDMVVIDYDGINMQYTAFLNTIKERLQEVSFILYPSISNYVGLMGMRFRLVIETSRLYTQKENDNLVQNVMDHIGIPADTASKTWAQLMGMPTVTKLSPASLITRQEGQPLDVDAYLFEPTPKEEYKPQVEFTGELTHDIAVGMVEAYTKRLANKLLDRDYFIKYPYMNIKHNFEVGIIDWETVQECLTILAMGNDDWAQDNIEHFKHDKANVKNGTPFADFFGWALESPEVDFGDLSDWGVNEVPAAPPKTMKEMYKVLKDEGFSWREEHTTYDKDGNPKVPPVSPRAVTNILKKHVHFAVVTDDDPEAAPLCAYDLDEGIYRRGERFIGKLILAVESTINKTGRSNILGWLEIESVEKEPTRDETLIVMNNGIFDRVQMLLIPFTPRYVFLTKVDVDYNPNVIEPTYKDWKFSDWLSELSDGDPMKIEQIWRVIYACLNGNYISQKLIFLYSEKGKTGKGTFQAILRNLVGRKNTAAIRLNQFETRWGVHNVVGKSLMIGDDNHPKDFIERCENLKSVAVGEYVQAEAKGKDAFFVSITAQIVQSFNGFPRINAFDDGFKHRLILIPFNHSYQENENRNIKQRYVKDRKLLEWIAHKVVHMKEVELFNTEDGKTALAEFEEENNNVLRFYNTFFSEFTSERLPIKFLFELYQAWNQEENNPTNTKQNTFTKDLKSIAEPEGWKYSRNSLAPLSYFHEPDMRKLDALSTSGYFINYPKKKQPLMRRDKD